MKAVLKISMILLILVSLLAVGCTGSTEADPINEVSAVGESEASFAEISPTDDDQLQRMEIVQNQPLQIMRDYTLYYKWHNSTRDILENYNGSKVRLYSYNMKFTGTIVHVGEFHVILHDSIAGTAYVDIDSLNAIIPSNEID